MNTVAQLRWKREKAEEEYARRRALHYAKYVTYYPMYHAFFHVYIRWILAWIPTDFCLYPTPLEERRVVGTAEFEHLCHQYNRCPVSLSGVSVFLDELLGEQFEAIFGCKAEVADYQYVADELSEQTQYLSPMPPTVTRALQWLEEKVVQHKVVTTNQQPNVSAVVNESETSFPESTAPSSPWVPLLADRFSLDEFFTILICCGLLTQDRKLTALGRADGVKKPKKAPWAGVIVALIQAKLLKLNSAAIRHALFDPEGEIGITINEGTIRDPSEVSKRYTKQANSVLRERGWLK
jgi:hypothetical protein